MLKIIETKTVTVYESSFSSKGMQFYDKEVKHTATLAFWDDQKQLIDGGVVHAQLKQKLTP